MKKTIKKAGLYFLCATILAAIKVYTYTYSQPIPLCGGVPEPPVEGICGVWGEQPCLEDPYCEHITFYGRKTDYCCETTADGTCRIFRARWKCCHYPEGDQWTPECKEVFKMEDATCVNKNTCRPN